MGYKITVVYPVPKREGQPKHTKPFVQKNRVLVGLVVFLLTLQTALVALYYYTQVNVLSASFFTHRIDLKGIESLESFSPFSIIPALCAVIVTLWWEAIEKCCRDLQPLIAMSQRPTRISKGLNLSYTTSLWFWTSIKSASNHHWILFSITIGSLLAQTRKYKETSSI